MIVIHHSRAALTAPTVAFPQDLMMPEVDGLHLLRFVRSHEWLRNLPVVSKFWSMPHAGCSP